MLTGNVVFEGGNMAVESKRGATVIRWPSPGGKPVRYAIAAFLGFWLFGWAAGGVFAAIELAYQLISRTHLAEVPFLLLFLCIWAFTIIRTFRLFCVVARRARPRIITLDGDRLTYDPGYDATDIMEIFKTDSSGRTMIGPVLRNSPEFTKSWLAPQKTVTFTRLEAGRVSLERVGERLRLTIDHGDDRQVLGASLMEAEKEWLATRLEQWRDGS